MWSLSQYIIIKQGANLHIRDGEGNTNKNVFRVIRQLVKFNFRITIYYLVHELAM